jgi:N-acetylglutamate synthase-like GNAT family acetyltransferase
MKIIHNNSLSQKIKNELIELISVCKNIDGTESKIYWDILNTQRSISGNFFYYNNKKLIGYLSFFLFEENAAHISALVHPDYRRQGVFLRLLHAASIEMQKIFIKKIIFPIPKQNEMAKSAVKFLSGNFLYDEYQMVREGVNLEEDNLLENNKLLENNNLSCQRALSWHLATLKDLELIAEIDSICFNSDYALVLKRFEDTIIDANRQIWLLNLEDKIIGKCHVHFDEKGAYLHNICILPDYQNSGYGKIFLKLIINQLIQSNHDYLYLDVIAHQIAAKHIYEKCHFKVTQVTEYWELLVD